MTEEALDLSAERIAAVATLWKQHRKSLRVRFDGVSMMPAIAPREEVRLICDGRTPRRGDVVAFLYREHLAVHRVVAISHDERWLLTRGDALFLPDRPVSIDAVIGCVAEVPEAAAQTTAERLFAALFRLSVAAADAVIATFTYLRNLRVALRHGPRH